MLRRSRLALIAFGCVASVSSAYAQESEIPALIGNRPGSVEARGSVGTGVLQLEGGFAVDFNPSEERSPRNVTTPGGLVRFGITRHVEVRVGGDGFKYSSASVDGARVGSRGTSDVYVGAKAVVLEEERAGFEFSVVPTLSLPTGSEAMTSTGYDPAVTFAFARELGRGFDATSAWSFASLSGEVERHREFEGSVAVGRPVTSRITLAGEIGRRSSSHEAPVWATGAALAFLVTSDVQADVQMSHDVRNASGWMVGAGFVIRHR